MTQTDRGPAATRIADEAELPAPGRWQLDPGHTELALCCVACSISASSCAVDGLCRVASATTA